MQRFALRTSMSPSLLSSIGVGDKFDGWENMSYSCSNSVMRNGDEEGGFRLLSLAIERTATGAQSTHRAQMMRRIAVPRNSNNVLRDSYWIQWMSRLVIRAVFSYSRHRKWRGEKKQQDVCSGNCSFWVVSQKPFVLVFADRGYLGLFRVIPCSRLEVGLWTVDKRIVYTKR